MTLTLQTRHIEATLDTLYAQYGYPWQVVSQREVDGWIEIVVEPDDKP